MNVVTRSRSRMFSRKDCRRGAKPSGSGARKDDPKPHIRDLCRPFGLRPSLKRLDPEYSEKLPGSTAGERSLRISDVPSLDGSDVYGLLLSRESRTRREIQEIEADFWGEDFDEVYNPE